MKRYHIEYFEAKKGWFFHIRKGGHILLDSGESYSSKSNCLRAIKRLKCINFDVCTINQIEA